MKASKVNENVVKMMTSFYGTVDTARQAYHELRATLKPYDGRCLWVALNGRITVQAVAAVQYSMSPDAEFVLP